MSADKSHRMLWYTRRDGVERGPYPEQQISRYILLGRIGDGDELKSDGGDWQALSAYPQLIPAVMQLPHTAENRQKLLMARMREDERQPGDRRERRPHLPVDNRDQRRDSERRQPEAEEVLRHRELRYAVAHEERHSAALYRYPLVASVLVLVGFLVSYGMERLEPEARAPDCAARPRPGVNWDNCNQVGLVANKVDLVGAHISNARMDTAQLVGARLAGVKLEYTSLNLSNLQQADLSHASMVGAALRGSDLRNTRLVNADLSYANLSGARIEGADFTGAILDNAIWIDQQPCIRGSVGVCNRYKK